jgi:D-aminoacyl-tRNA deacylase
MLVCPGHATAAAAKSYVPKLQNATITPTYGCPRRDLASRVLIALLQRVLRAEVSVAGRRIAAIDAGLLAFIGVAARDDATHVERLLERLLGFRVFEEACASDGRSRMNLSLAQTLGGLLLVPQFTLAADTRKGNRASFHTAAAPPLGRELFELLVTRARALHGRVESGEFGASMQVALVNDGPVTFWLET